jgi:hypothetical protein
MYAQNHVTALREIAAHYRNEARLKRTDASHQESEALKIETCANWIERALAKEDQALCAIAARTCPPDAAFIFAKVEESDETKARAIQIMFQAIERAEAKEATHGK